MKCYVNNLKTGRIELHFTKEEYLQLPEDLKKELKSKYLFSRYAKAWVSKSKNNHYSALIVAEKLGFQEEEKQGNKLSYEEELKIKAQKAEARAERFAAYSENATKRAEGLQSEFNSMRGDIAFFTQPIIRGHKGSESFSKRRDQVINRYEKGFEEYRKSEYFKGKQRSAEASAEQKYLKNKTYLYNRIKECESIIKKYQSYIISAEEKGNNRVLEKYLSAIEYQIDKQGFLQNCLDELGGIIYSKENIKPGYIVKIRGTWEKVLKANKTTVETEVIEGGAKGFILKYPYAEIREMIIPKDYKEPKDEMQNPFEINDIVVRYNISSDRIIAAFQIVNVTSKTVKIQEIKIEDGKPILNEFKASSKQERKTVKKDRNGNYVLNDNNWYLYKWKENLNEKQIV